MSDILNKISKAEEKAKELFGGGDKTSTNQVRAVFAHLRTLECLKDEQLQLELKLFVARMFYKSKRKTGALSDNLYKFLKETFASKEMSSQSFLENMKYFEAVVAYGYPYFGK